jgi:hypothetical protein
LLVANLARLNEAEEADSRGVHNILGVFENLFSFMPPLADTVVSDTTLLPWLLQRIAKKEFDSNKQYASEILAIVLQQSSGNVARLLELDGLESLLGALAVSCEAEREPARTSEGRQGWTRAGLMAAIPQDGSGRWRGSGVYGGLLQLCLHRAGAARGEEGVLREGGCRVDDHHDEVSRHAGWVGRADGQGEASGQDEGHQGA